MGRMEGRCFAILKLILYNPIVIYERLEEVEKEFLHSDIVVLPGTQIKAWNPDYPSITEKIDRQRDRWRFCHVSGELDPSQHSQEDQGIRWYFCHDKGMLDTSLQAQELEEQIKAITNIMHLYELLMAVMISEDGAQTAGKTPLGILERVVQNSLKKKGGSGAQDSQRPLPR